MFSTPARPPATRRILAQAATAGCLLLAVTACSSRVPAASKTRAEPVVALATPSAVATPSTKPRPKKSVPPIVPLGPFDTASEVKELFVALVENYCAPAYQQGTARPVDPRKATVHRGPTKNEWLVTDKAGDKVVINTSSNRVYSTEGPAGMLPADYTFDCDGVVFPGTWD